MREGAVEVAAAAAVESGMKRARARLDVVAGVEAGEEVEVAPGLKG